MHTSLNARVLQPFADIHYISTSNNATHLVQEAVMKGWQQGLPGMKVGGKRLLRIPAGDLTKGGNNEDLEFEVELLSVAEGAFNELLIKNGIGANVKTYGIIALLIISAILPQLEKAGIIT